MVLIIAFEIGQFYVKLETYLATAQVIFFYHWIFRQVATD